MFYFYFEQIKETNSKQFDLEMSYFTCIDKLFKRNYIQGNFGDNSALTQLQEEGELIEILFMEMLTEPLKYLC